MPNENRTEARALVAQAGQLYADAFAETAGAIVTGYIGVFEMTTARGRYCVWLAGGGADPTSEDPDGLAPWRIEGMLRYTIRQLPSPSVELADD